MVRELSKHPQVLADVLSLSAASDEAKTAAAREMTLDGAGGIPCIDALKGEAACPVPVDAYQVGLVGEGVACFADRRGIPVFWWWGLEFSTFFSCFYICAHVYCK